MSDDIRERFDAAVEKVRNAPQEGDFKPSNDFKLKMYGLYRQANDGDVHGKKPSMIHPLARYKWEAWAANKGMATEDAMQQYIDAVNEIEQQYG